MGIRIFGSSFGDTTTPGNPKPNNFIVERTEQCGQFYVSVVRYPDCTNYEGKKILVTRKAVDSRAPLESTAYRDWETDRKSTRNSSHSAKSRMPSSD